eukprot:741532-Amphidinium_carterae.1
MLPNVASGCIYYMTVCRHFQIWVWTTGIGIDTSYRPGTLKPAFAGIDTVVILTSASPRVSQAESVQPTMRHS